MGLPGSKPAERPTRRRNKPTHDWTEVDAVLFADAPGLPGRWSVNVLRWWQAVSTMPHCVLWDDSDWQFAMDTAHVAKAFYKGNLKAATELRQREKVMGTTVDARRDLRIRYVEPTVETPVGITAIDEYKQRLGLERDG